MEQEDANTVSDTERQKYKFEWFDVDDRSAVLPFLQK